ncbi:hypothetical protein BC828DRAFT_436283 [Blastocladiella britannica]|nr:hypothetical protein BC828DRAFT_436283 [Blastocladiella britannica]
MSGHGAWRPTDFTSSSSESESDAEAELELDDTTGFDQSATTVVGSRRAPRPPRPAAPATPTDPHKVSAADLLRRAVEGAVSDERAHLLALQLLGNPSGSGPGIGSGNGSVLGNGFGSGSKGSAPSLTGSSFSAATTSAGATASDALLHASPSVDATSLARSASLMSQPRSFASATRRAIVPVSATSYLGATTTTTTPPLADASPSVGSAALPGSTAHSPPLLPPPSPYIASPPIASSPSPSSSMSVGTLERSAATKQYLEERYAAIYRAIAPPPSPAPRRRGNAWNPLRAVRWRFSGSSPPPPPPPLLPRPPPPSSGAPGDQHASPFPMGRYTRINAWEVANDELYLVALPEPPPPMSVTPASPQRSNAGGDGTDDVANGGTRVGSAPGSEKSGRAAAASGTNGSLGRTDTASGPVLSPRSSIIGSAKAAFTPPPAADPTLLGRRFGSESRRGSAAPLAITTAEGDAYQQQQQQQSLYPTGSVVLVGDDSPGVPPPALNLSFLVRPLPSSGAGSTGQATPPLVGSTPASPTTRGGGQYASYPTSPTDGGDDGPTSPLSDRSALWRAAIAAEPVVHVSPAVAREMHESVTAAILAPPSVLARLGQYDQVCTDMLDAVRGAQTEAETACALRAGESAAAIAAFESLGELEAVLAQWSSAVTRADAELGAVKDQCVRPAELGVEQVAAVVEDLGWAVGGDYLQTIKRIDDHLAGRRSAAGRPGRQGLRRTDDTLLEAGFTLLSYLLAGLSLVLWVVLLATRVMKRILTVVSAPFRAVARLVRRSTTSLPVGDPAPSSADLGTAPFSWGVAATGRSPEEIARLTSAAADGMSEQLARLSSPEEWKARIEHLLAETGGSVVSAVPGSAGPRRRHTSVRSDTIRPQ